VKISKSHLSDILLTSLAPISWGTTYIVATEFLPPNHPLLVASMRSLPIGLLLTIGLRKLPKGNWWWRMLILGGLNIGVFQALLFVAAYRLPGGVAATAGAIQPLLVGFFAWAILSVKPSKISVIAAISGFIGVGLLVLGPSAQLDTIGIIAAVAGAGAMGLGTVLVKRWQPTVSLIVFTAWQLTIGGAMLLPIALITEGPFTEVTRTNLWGFIYLGLIGTALAYALLQETFSPVQMAGVATVLVSIIIGQQAGSAKQSSNTDHPKTHHSDPS
jgi:probable blue pigment (indigoidine) exporter